ncbi:MAG: nucleotide exchange factor GrpE [Holosporales bacterium]|jgi:molecular chaperone GrpE|nr:nucleotide exchange factor GrpE [Holosporales bacterium]
MNYCDKGSFDRNPIDEPEEMVKSEENRNYCGCGCSGDHASDVQDDVSERTEYSEAYVADLKSQYMRALAEIENTRRRAQKEKEDTIKFGATGLARDIVPFVDNLDRALKNVPSGDLGTEITPFIDGVSMIFRDVTSILEKHGIVKIETDGKHFNPEFHQAVSEVAAKGVASGTIIETLQAGYVINGRLLRAAIVSVAK